MVVGEMDDRSQRLAVIKVVLEHGVSGQCRDAGLYPRVATNPLRLRQGEVLHNAKALRVRPVLGMPESRPGILVGVGKRQFVPKGVFFQKAESVANADIVIGLRQESGPDEIRPQHDEKVMLVLEPCAPFVVGLLGASCAVHAEASHSVRKQTAKIVLKCIPVVVETGRNLDILSLQMLNELMSASFPSSLLT